MGDLRADAVPLTSKQRLGLMRRRHAILVGTVAVALAIVGWALASLRDDDSSMRVLVRAAKHRMCWPEDSSLSCVLKAISKYDKKGRFDDAIKVGAAWTSQYPNSPANGMIYADISTLYLKKATRDPGRTEEYLKQALSCRDKALQSLSDSAYALRPLVDISEYVGDISQAQRCIQYGNSLRILDRMSLLAKEEKDRLTRQFKPDLAERKQLEDLSEWIDVAMKRVSNKSSSSGCQDKPSLAG